MPSLKAAVATVLDAIHTGFVVRLRATSAEHNTTAAAPSLTGQISYRRSGQLTTRDLSTSSTVNCWRKRALELCCPAWCAFTAIFASCSSVVP